MRFVIVTGMSGAGRSSAMRILEDDGYFCVDNLPVSLLPTFMELTKNSSEQIEKSGAGAGYSCRSRSIAGDSKCTPVVESQRI